jgi:aryl-alcohol dehydrogenase
LVPVRIEAAVVRQGTATPVIETLDLEAPRAGELLVRIEAAGVCHTDLRVAAIERFPRPIVLGHEGAGVVERIGEGVTGFAPGERVVMSYAFCGACPVCRGGAIAYCQRTGELNFGGRRADGTTPLSKDGEPIASFFGQSSFATHAICEARSAIKLADDVPFEIAAPLGCGIQTGAGAILNSMAVKAGQSVAVFGTGSVGLSAVMAAKVAGASKIIAVDVNPARLKLALELGASNAVDAGKDDPVQAVKDITGVGADVVLNTTDIAAVYHQGLACLAPLGTFGFVTSPGPGFEVDMSALMLGGRSIRGIVQGDSVPRDFIPRLIDLWREGRFPIERMITTYPFADVAAAMYDSETGVSIKPVLSMN